MQRGNGNSEKQARGLMLRGSGLNGVRTNQ